MSQNLRITTPFVRWLCVSGALMVAVVGGACGGGVDIPRIDVAPDVEVADSVAVGEPIKLRYGWSAGADFVAPADDYKVFVHLRDPEGEILLQDDHYPPLPTSQWTTGHVEAYERWLYPDALLEVEHIDIDIGLYTDDGRAQVRWNNSWEDAPRVHRMEVRTGDLAGLPVYVEGWYPEEESTTEGYRRPWRWTSESARAAFVNPRQPAMLHFIGHSPVAELASPQTITLRIGDQDLATMIINEAAIFTERLEVPSEVLGDEDWAELTIEVEPTLTPSEVTPGSSDIRVLGVQVFNLYLAVGP